MAISKAKRAAAAKKAARTRKRNAAASRRKAAPKRRVAPKRKATKSLISQSVTSRGLNKIHQLSIKPGRTYKFVIEK